MKKIKNIIIDNLKTLFYALVIAILIRSLFFQPFYIPSSSMEPTLLIGDRIFVSKYSYGYSKHSFPFSPPVYNKRVFFKNPQRGDLVIFPSSFTYPHEVLPVKSGTRYSIITWVR